MVFGRRYRVTEKIGTGGMAEVYKAVDEVLGRTVAVKVMHQRYAADPSYAARFRQEAQAAANLQSPYIVNIYDWGQDDDTYYIVMELVRGTDLKSIIQEKGAVNSRRVAELGMQICSALSIAHGYDVIHRDIKPQNIMVTPDGSVKVMDFGIARAGNTTMTQTGSVLGTAHYVSPEQAQGRPLNAASDLYSLGIVLYEAATGKLPFDADSPVAVALKQVNEQPLPPAQVNSSVDPNLEAVIMTAMTKDPGARYDTAEEMRRDLQRVVQGRDVVGGVEPAAVATAAQPTAVMPAVDSDPYGAAGRSPRPPAKKPIWPWIVLAAVLVAAGLGVAWGMGLLGPQGAAIPEVVGMPQADAEAAIVQARFVVGEVKSEPSAEVEAGSVIDQSPVAGAEAELGSAVNLTVSTGPLQVDVPNIVGLSEAEAVKILGEAGFRAQSLPDEPDSKAPVGEVIRQNPEGGEKTDEGSIIEYVVSRGPQTATVPDVEGQTQSSAEAELKDAKFKSKAVSQYSDSVKKGTVISQNPSKGFVVIEGSTVTIYVSKGPESVEVPAVIGKAELDAIEAIEKAGLKVDKQYALQTNSGNVYDQSPAAGDKVPPGSTVTITIDAEAD